jgi:hypothetical protein
MTALDLRLAIHPRMRSSCRRSVCAVSARDCPGVRAGEVVNGILALDGKKAAPRRADGVMADGLYVSTLQFDR